MDTTLRNSPFFLFVGHGAFGKIKKLKRQSIQFMNTADQMPHVSIFVGNGAFSKIKKVKSLPTYSWNTTW
jgi:hypothetical protein